MASNLSENTISERRGVAGRNSDNTFIKQVLDWEPSIPFRTGLGENLCLDRAAVRRSKSRKTYCSRPRITKLMDP